MDIDFEKREWESLTYRENQLLFLWQKWLLDMLLEWNVISKAQYENFNDLTLKMGTGVEAIKEKMSD